MGVMNYLRRITRKANKAPTMTAENAEQMAASRAKFEVKSRFGRAAQSRVANVLRPEEGPHNIVGKEEKALAEKYKQQYIRKLEKITNVEKLGLLQFAKKLRLQVNQHIKMGGGADKNGNQGNLMVEIPMTIVKILLFAIGVALLVFSIGAGIAAALFTGSNSGMTSMSLASFSLMGLDTQGTQEDEGE